MLLKVLRAKIHRATVTQADLDYVGSITIDRDLMDAVGVLDGEFVLVAGLDGGSRFETYVIEGERGNGVICINGAAAHLVRPGEKVIIMAYAYTDPDEARRLEPQVILVDEHNRVQRRL